MARPMTVAWTQRVALLSTRTIMRARMTPPRLIAFASVGLGGAALYTPTSCKAAPSGANLLQEADTLFAENKYDVLASMLRAALMSQPDDAELCWRLGRACKKQADAEAPKSERRKALIKEGLQLAQKAVELKEACGSAHKCVAVRCIRTLPRHVCGRSHAATLMRGSALRSLTTLQSSQRSHPVSIIPQMVRHSALGGGLI